MKRTILHINTSPHLRGGERQNRLLMEGLEARGWRNYLACRRGAPFARDNGLDAERIFAIPMRGEIDFIAGSRIAAFARKIGAVIVHCHTAHAHSYGLMVKALRRIPLVVTRRVDFPLKSGSISKWKYRRADRIIAISRRIRDILLEAGISPRKLSLVHSGVKLQGEANTETALKLRRELNIPPVARIIGTIAALAEHKDYPTLLKAFKIVREHNSEVVLLSLGEGAERLKLERMTTDLALTDSVRFLGFRNDVENFWGLFDVYVQSSRLEGLCSSLIEAMYYKLPIAATSAGGIPDLIEHNVNGLLSEPGDADNLGQNILILLNNIEMAAKLGETAHRESLNFTADKMVEGTEQTYLKLLGEINA